MGCSTIKPIPRNFCDVPLNQYSPEIHNFCAPIGPLGTNARQTFCNSLSNANEWGGERYTVNNCTYNDVTREDGGICTTPGGFQGGGLQCKRTYFSGDPYSCCFKDYDHLGSEQNCFSDPGMQNTCAYEYRNVAGPGCQDLLMKYCVGEAPGDDPNSIQWMDRWNDTTRGCTYALYRNMFPGLPVPPIPSGGTCNLPPSGIVSASGLYWGQSLVRKAMEKYQKQGFVIGSEPGTPTWSVWQDVLYEKVCCPYPSLCQPGLGSICKNNTTEKISKSIESTKWCGCHMPAAEYEEYSSKFNIPPQCSPLCNKPGVIPIASGSLLPVLCKQNICVIDNITANIANTNVGGITSISQICGNCKSGQCACTISNSDFVLNNTTIGGNANIISQQCGTMNCLQNNTMEGGPDNITVDCTDQQENPFREYQDNFLKEKQIAQRYNSFFTVIVILIALVIVILLILFIKPVLNYSRVN